MSRKKTVSSPPRKKRFAYPAPISSLALENRSTKAMKIITPVAKPRLTDRYLMSGLGMK